MKIYVCYFLISLVALFSLSSCEEEALYGSKGGFTVSLVDDLTGMVVTKSTPAELGTPLTSLFALQIRNAETGVLAYDGLCNHTYYEVPAATYDLVVSYGENPDLAFDSPYYKGELTNQTVESSGKNVSIPCSVANALVSVRYVNPSIFDLAFTSYGLVAKVGESSLDWTSSNAEKSVYLKAGSSVSFVFKGILKGSDQEVEFPVQQGLPETYEAKDHYILYLNYQAGESKLNITTERKEATINETVPQSWLPKPSTESTDFVNKVLTMKETMNPNAAINLKVARPLQDLRFKLELEDPNFQDLNKEYILSTLSNEDKVALEMAGVVLPDIGSSEPSINMSGLAGKLQTINGGQTVNNYISINPKANDRWNTVEGEYGEKYTIQVEKPEFKAIVYPGDIWTKEFTVTPSVLSGNPDVLIPGLKYEYSADGTIWEEFDNENMVTGLIPQTSYMVRGKYRDIISDAFDVSTYPKVALENGGLEGASIIRGTDSPGFFGAQYGALYSWSSWGTLNAVTAGSCPATAYSYNSRSGTRPTTDKPNSSPGSNAVRIITLSYGYGGTDATPKNFTHSELYLGTTANDSGDKNYGISCNSHPTGVKFWYKCISNIGNDVSQAKIQIYSDDILVGENTFETGRQDAYINYTLNINYSDDKDKRMLKPNKLVIIFKSGIKDNLSKSDLKQFSSGLFNKLTDAMWRGNEFFIDDVELVYDK